MGRTTPGTKLGRPPFTVEPLHALSTKRTKETESAKKAKITKAERKRSDKAAGARNSSSATRTLTAPLSALMNGPDFVPVRNVALWVGRSAEMRRMEAEPQNGHIKRPLNAFMLYRFAYINRARAWCWDNQQNNLSIIIGKSWFMENDEVCSTYKEYARVEKANHRIAHPEYKFRPRKLRITLLRRNSSSRFDMDGVTLLEKDQLTPATSWTTVERPWEEHMPSPAPACSAEAPAELDWVTTPVHRHVCSPQWLAPNKGQPPFWLPANGFLETGSFQCTAKPDIDPSKAVCLHAFAEALEIRRQLAASLWDGTERSELRSACTHIQRSIKDHAAPLMSGRCEHLDRQHRVCVWLSRWN